MAEEGELAGSNNLSRVAVSIHCNHNATDAVLTSRMGPAQAAIAAYATIALRSDTAVMQLCSMQGRWWAGRQEMEQLGSQAMEQLGSAEQQDAVAQQHLRCQCSQQLTHYHMFCHVQLSQLCRQQHIVGARILPAPVDALLQGSWSSTCGDTCREALYQLLLLTTCRCCCRSAAMLLMTSSL
jgi:hypothetical protein